MANSKVQSGQTLDTAGQALQRPRNLPLIRDVHEQLGAHVRATAADMVGRGQESREVLAQGQLAAPRGMATTEVLGAHLQLTQPRRRFVSVPPVRVLNPAFAVADALWILSGSDEPWIFTYNRSLRPGRPG